jgi:hypothetical protein
VSSQATYGEFSLSASSPRNIDEYDGRFDENLNDRNRFFVRASNHSYKVPFPHVIPNAGLVAWSANTVTQNSFNGGVNCTFLKSPPSD